MPACTMHGRAPNPGEWPGMESCPMLELRPGCECCDRDLPAHATDARICSFECTFCAECADRMGGVCPNCGGELVARPRRPEGRLARNPASTLRIHKPAGCGPVR